MSKKILMAVFLSLVAGAQEREFKNKIDEQKQRLKNLVRQEKSLHQELFQTQRRSEELLRQITKQENQKKELEQKIRENNSNLTSTDQSLHKLDVEVFYRIQGFWKRRRPDTLQAFLSSASMPEFHYKQLLVRHWLRQEGKALSRYYDQSKDLMGRKKSLERDRRSLAELLQSLEVKKASLSKERQERTRLLALVRDQKDYYAQNIEELEKAAQNLQALISNFETTIEMDSRFKQMRGKLLLPVMGRLEKEYGEYTDPRLKTKVYHKGIDIRAAMGRSVRAVFDGKVVYADWFVGYGKIIIVDHDGEYFTLYAHLSQVLKDVGDDVVVGEPIGKVGDTGSLKGAYLYFELRKKGISENPLPWFSKSLRR